VAAVSKRYLKKSLATAEEQSCILLSHAVLALLLATTNAPVVQPAVTKRSNINATMTPSPALLVLSSWRNPVHAGRKPSRTSPAGGTKFLAVYLVVGN
jgi:hypothetical protein